MAVSPRPPSSKRKPMAAPVSPRPPGSTHNKSGEEQLASEPVQQGDADLVGSSVDGARSGPADLSTTCHQCRQKTENVSVTCTNVKKRPCRIKMCFKCLLNRYGEIATAEEASGNWKCPRCRGICNCSICMKKKGQVPTGILAPMARSGGFSSVSELLQVQGGKSVTGESVDDIGDKGQASMDRNTASANGHLNSISEAAEQKKKVVTKKVLALQKKSKICNGGENDIGDKDQAPMDIKTASENGHLSSISEAAEKKRKVGTKKELALHQKQSKICNGGENNLGDKGQAPMDIKTASENGHLNSISEAAEKKRKVGTKKVLTLHQKQAKICNGGENSLGDKGQTPMDIKKASENVNLNSISEAAQKKKKVDTKKASAFHQKQSKICNGGEKSVKAKSYEIDNMENSTLNNCSSQVEIKPPVICATQSHPLGPLNRTATANFEFPQGKPLMNVADIELSPEDVGLSLQFLEFCTTFAKFLDLHKGQAVSILRDLICSRGRVGRQSSSIQFQVKLLSMLKHHNKAGETQWLKALQKCFSETKFARKDLPSDFGSGSYGYEKLSSSEKLKMLLFLCDEILDTEALRIWIDKENEKFSQRRKEANAKLLEIKEKEKSLLKNLNNVAQPNGSSYPNSVQRKIANIKTEIDKVRSEKLEASRGVNQSKKYSDAIGTRPLYNDSKGRYFWSLNSCSVNGPPMLIQEAKALDMTIPEENWFFYEDEEATKAEKFMSNFKKRARIN